MTRNKPTGDAAETREKHRMAAIRRCNDAVLSLRDLTDRTDPQELNDLSSEALLRLQGAITEVEGLRTRIYE